MKFLAAYPETDISGNGYNYLLDAMYDGVIQKDIFLFLLESSDVDVDQDLIDEALDYAVHDGGDLDFRDALLENPKTRQYALAYYARSTRQDRKYSSSEEDYSASA